MLIALSTTIVPGDFSETRRNALHVLTPLLPLHGTCEIKIRRACAAGNPGPAKSQAETR